MTRKKASPQQLQLAGFELDSSVLESNDCSDCNVPEPSSDTTDAGFIVSEAKIQQQPACSTTDKLVILVDSHSLIYQVFHAMPTMTAPDGTEVGAIHGFFRDLIELKTRFDPDYLLCCFDLSEETFRNQIYDQYKANRESMPAALHAQVERIRASMSVLGIPSLGLAGYEADDLLATLSLAAESHGYRVLLVTSDKDCRQLLSDKTQMINLRKGTTYGPAELQEDWGIRPDQVIDFQSMVGDSVDNVPGVPKIGPKAAQELLSQFGSLDGVYNNLDQITAKARKQTLEDHRNQAYLSKSLVGLKRDVPIEFAWKEWFRPQANKVALEKLFQELGFRKLADRFLKYTDDDQVADALPESNIDRTRYRCIDNLQKLVQLKKELDIFFTNASVQQRVLSIDTETTSTSPAAADLVGISMAWPDATPVYIPVQGPAAQSDRVLKLDDVRDNVGPFLTDSSIGKIGQNLKYDLTVLANHGFVVKNVAFDTMIADYLCSPGDRNHSLDELAKRILNHTMIPISQLIGTGKNQITMDKVDLELVTEYAAEDADIALQIMPTMQEKLIAINSDSVFREIELPLISVLADMERIGIAIDKNVLSQLQVEFNQRADELRQSIYAQAGREFNADSPKQLAQILFEELKLRVVKRSKSGPSTDIDVLQELASEHPLPALIIEHRSMTKLISTYIEALPKLVNPKTNRIHTSFRQDVAATGRLSSSDPNLQNIPIRTDEGKRIRGAFKPKPEGWKFLAADYSQIELRMMAHYCDDETLKAAFYNDEDIHAAVAAQVYGVAVSDVTSQQRRSAKAINFGILYGQSPFGLAKSLGIPKTDAADFIDAYFARFSRVRQFMLDTLHQARNDGYVSTMSGRRRYLKGIRDFTTLNSQQQKTLLEPERMAVNTVIQGSAADLIKIAMVRVWKRLRQSKLQAQLLLQIHDELLFEVHPDDEQELSELVEQEMLSAVKLSVPLSVDIQSGYSWAEC